MEYFTCKSMKRVGGQKNNISFGLTQSMKLKLISSAVLMPQTQDTEQTAL